MRSSAGVRQMKPPAFLMLQITEGSFSFLHHSPSRTGPQKRSRPWPIRGAEMAQRKRCLRRSQPCPSVFFDCQTQEDARSGSCNKQPIRHTSLTSKAGGENSSAELCRLAPHRRHRDFIYTHPSCGGTALLAFWFPSSACKPAVVGLPFSLNIE